MKAFTVLAVWLALIMTAYGDLSYKVVRRAGGALGDEHASSYYLKGQKMKVVDDGVIRIFDFEAHTMTSIFPATRRYIVRNFNENAAGAKPSSVELKVSAKDTGRKKNAGGFDARELLITVEAVAPQPATKSIEIEMWLSTGVPGSAELAELVQKQAGLLPWAAVGRIADHSLRSLTADPFLVCFEWAVCNSSQSLQAGVAKVQQAVVALGGVLVEQVVRVNTGTPIEATTTFINFSTSVLADTFFALPEGYQGGPLAVPNSASAGEIVPGTACTGDDNALRIGADVTPPAAISQVSPTYTKQARKAKLSGVVVLGLIVDTDGHACNIRFLRSLGMGLNESAVEAVKKWKFRPSTRDGVPVKVQATVEVNFRMPDSAPKH